MDRLRLNRFAAPMLLVVVTLPATAAIAGGHDQAPKAKVVRTIDFFSPLLLDLDDDRAPDFYAARRNGALDVRSGRTGALLWSKESVGPAQVWSARVGPTARPGLLVGDSQSLTAYDARGKELWSRSWTPGIQSVQFVDTAAQILPGDAEDFVVVTTTTVWTVLPLVSIDVLDGATGKVGLRKEVLRGTTVTVLEDMSGDGLADIVLYYEKDVYPAGVPIPDHLIAIEGDTGQILWTAEKFASPSAAGDVDGDGVSDVLVSPRAVLSGSNGKQLFSLPHDWTIPVGDVNGDGEDDIAVTLTHQTAGRLCATHEAYGYPGRRLYRGTECMKLDPKYEPYLYVEPWAGDVDNDGVRDYVSVVALFDTQNFDPIPSPVLSRSSFISGKTGSVLWQSDACCVLLREPLADPGADMAMTKEFKYAFEVTAIRGSNGETQWVGRCDAPGEWSTLGAPYPAPDGLVAADVSGDGRGDVMCFLRFSSKHSELWRVTALSGRDGHRLWSVGWTDEG